MTKAYSRNEEDFHEDLSDVLDSLESDGSVLRGKACTCGALGTGSAAGRTTAEFSSLRTQAHGYGVPGTHEGEQHG